MSLKIKLFIAVLAIALAPELPAQTGGNPDPYELAGLNMAGPNHKLLEKFVGKWRLLYRINSIDPYTSPTYGKGETENEIILQNKFLDMHGMMIYEHMKLNMRMTIGYDAARKKYTFYYIDASRTGAYYAIGEYSDSTGVYTFHGEDYNPIEEKQIPYRVTLRFEREDKYILEMYIQKDDAEMKLLEFQYVKIE
ncbi:MAG: DUF1579 family protein [Candidatus Kapaibacterium sp.]